MKVGDVVTTRYFGGYERVEITEVNDDYAVVARFGGQGFDLMPLDKIEKVVREAPSSAHH